MKNIIYVLLSFAIVFLPSCKDEDPCVESTWYQDADGDGLGNANAALSACEQPDGYVSNSDDADDTCVESLWYQDLDGDGLGNPDVSLSACTQPDGYVDN